MNNAHVLNVLVLSLFSFNSIIVGLFHQAQARLLQHISTLATTTNLTRFVERSVRSFKGLGNDYTFRHEVLRK